MSTRKTIGILGGLGPESTIAYYAQITREYHRRCGDYAYPNIVIYSLSFQEIIDAGYEKPTKVKGAIEALAAAGADFVVAACNSIHTVYDQVAAQIPIPWISIISATAEQIKPAGITKVALLGTKVTMGGGFFQRALARDGIECITPHGDAQERINRIIFDELVIARTTAQSRSFVLQCIEDMRQAGAGGVILACTELPFLIRQSDMDLPVFDTSVIGAHKALDLAMGQN